MSTSTSVSGRSPRILSCVLCQKRKIKCDKRTPCTNCEKGGNTCVPSTPAPPRKRRRMNEVLLERLAKCEALLKQYEGVPPPNGSGASTSQSTTPYDHTTGNTDASQSGSDSEEDNFDFKVSAALKPVGSFVLEEGSAKYVDSFPWATIQGQLKSIRQILEDEEGSPSEADSSMPPQLEKNLLDDITLINLESVTPNPAQIFWLWNIFLERVNPLTKLIHVPSMQQFVVEASGRHCSIPMNSQALLFSIYLISTVTLTESEALEMLHMSRDEALHKFTLGTKAALYRAKFLESFDTTILQALVLFLESRHGRTSRHTTWILSGVMVRMALKLGLHRDGSSLDITPFEAEMRRRLWWRIMVSETKFSLASGYGEPLKIKDCDTQLPHNVNDADLYPSFMEPVQSREAPTEMALCLLLYHFCQFAIETRITDLHTLSHGFGAEKSQARDHALTTYKDMVQNLNAQLLASNYIDPSVSGVHLMADKFRACIVGDLLSIMVPMHDLPEWGTEIFSPEDNLFRICLTHFEHHFDMYEQIKDTSFLWFPRVQFETDAMLYIASQLQNRTQGSLVDRSWKLLECAYRWHPELWDMSLKDNVTLGLAILRAWRQREKNIGTPGLSSDAPSIIPKLQAVVPQTNLNPSPIPPVSTLPHPQTTLPSSQAAYLDTAWIVDQLSSYQLDGSAFDLDQLQWHQN
ncbi:unnamed protein product [Clonostachys rosea]|uniref:Zn(2)-C6 fungal-type domain-containing protein n=1 Tax=Bionectria ochroleuca TaxID=29856 RepID=A0ABY6TXH7_BIOOC|nr:unnamed protein product [Clonostachys rosea]